MGRWVDVEFASEAGWWWMVELVIVLKVGEVMAVGGGGDCREW